MRFWLGLRLGNRLTAVVQSLELGTTPQTPKSVAALLADFSINFFFSTEKWVMCMKTSAVISGWSVWPGENSRELVVQDPPPNSAIVNQEEP